MKILRQSKKNYRISSHAWAQLPDVVLTITLSQGTFQQLHRRRGKRRRKEENSADPRKIMIPDPYRNIKVQ